MLPSEGAQPRALSSLLPAAPARRSNELWVAQRAHDWGHPPGGAWHRPPHAGRPVLELPPGLTHPGSALLRYKATCALTQVSAVMRSRGIAAQAAAAGASAERHMRAAPKLRCRVALPQVAARFYVLRKGFEYVAEVRWRSWAPAALRVRMGLCS
jgi:hypothetical protein